MYVIFPQAPEDKLLRLDYKGDPLAFVSLKNIPEEFLPFEPQHLQYLDGKLYLADLIDMNFIITDTEGNFQKGYSIKKKLLQIQEQFLNRPGEEVFRDQEKLKFLEIAGFCVDLDGNIYFTISDLFSAFKLSADGSTLGSFGISGSSPGKFGVVAGITTDKNGTIYITDRLRSVVLIFAPSFEFISEFGYRGLQPGRLIVPNDIVVDDENGYIYVAQAANRGVSVYKIIED